MDALTLSNLLMVCCTNMWEAVCNPSYMSAGARDVASMYLRQHRMGGEHVMHCLKSLAHE